ncbi:MAG: nucleotidyltransferase domain-containing protein [Acidimicrobiia bacterium]|nr:nucleotidyltransferase domain-containing protein [Acidimicrobiia bacterium]MYJ15595.1 nucleotidyltransferase domain-containing protein [Acidimicrobiia bacterium]
MEGRVGRVQNSSLCVGAHYGADGMRMVVSSFVPTLAEVERAAKVMAGAGAGSVLVFGSVVRGDAHRHSDIDLMVIYDDLDYAVRQDLAMELERLAAAEVGCRVDVHLTDRPEWKMRTEQVVTSFESRIKRQAVVVVDKEPGEVDWDKEMVMPDSDYQEAVERLRQAANALVSVSASLEPTSYQRLLEESGQEAESFAVYEQRLAQGCAAGHLAVETGLKALIHLLSSPQAQAWGHGIERLLSQLPEPHRRKIESRLARVGVNNLQKWQEQARYQRFVTPTPEGFAAIAEAAGCVVLYAADQFPSDPDMATRVRRLVSFIRQEIARRDLYTGHDRTKREGPGLSLDQ